jgi:hypothetical protein
MLLPHQQDDAQRPADITTAVTPPLAYSAGDDEQAVGLRKAHEQCLPRSPSPR